MSKGSTKVDAPDPIAVAQADARFNRIDQFTPFGNLQFSGPDRNRADLTLNPAVQDLENRRLASDRLLLDTALSRQGDIKGGSLPSLTSNVNPTGLQSFFGLPQNLQSGTDAPANVPNVPDSIGGFQNANAPAQGKGGTRTFGSGQQGKGGVTPQGASTLGRIPGSPQDFGGKLQPGPINDQPGQLQGTQGQPQQDGPFGGSIGGLIDPNTFGQIGSLDQLEDFELDRGRVEQNFFDRASGLLNPQFDQAQQRLQQDLASRGIPRDSDAGRREIANFERGKGETFGRLANDAVLQGGGEQSRLFGLSSALGDRTQGAQGQLFQMADLLGQRDIQAQLQNANVAQGNRATQFNELASLLGLQQVAQPGLNNFFAPANADVTGGFALNQQAQQGNANRSAGMKGGALGGATDLGAAQIGSK